LNRGVTLESLGRYTEAAADYQAVLLAQPNDPAAWNNLGNVKVEEVHILMPVINQGSHSYLLNLSSFSMNFRFWNSTT